MKNLTLQVVIWTTTIIPLMINISWMVLPSTKDHHISPLDSFKHDQNMMKILKFQMHWNGTTN